MLSVAITRTALSLGALTIDDQPKSVGLWIPEDGLGRVGKSWRRRTVSSPFINGSVQVGAVLDDGSIPLALYAQAATTAALRTLQDEVEAALFQWSFDLTIAEDGQADTYSCDCADVAWNAYDSGMTRAHLARATVTIPCYPVGA